LLCFSTKQDAVKLVRQPEMPVNQAFEEMLAKGNFDDKQMCLIATFQFRFAFLE